MFTDTAQQIHLDLVRLVMLLKPILFLSGIAGGGKTSKAKDLSEVTGLPYFDMSTQLVANGFAPQFGVFADIELVNLVFSYLLFENPKGFILSGFPRNIAQATQIGSKLKQEGKPLLVVDLLLDYQLAVERLVNRSTKHFERAITRENAELKALLYNQFIREAIQELEKYCSYPAITVDTSGPKDQVNQVLVSQICLALENIKNKQPIPCL